jgi:hypothetical protein
MSRQPLIPDALSPLVIITYFVVWSILYLPWWLVRRLRDPHAV